MAPQNGPDGALSPRRARPSQTSCALAALSRLIARRSLRRLLLQRTDTVVRRVGRWDGWPPAGDDRWGNDYFDEGLSDRSRTLIIVLPSVFGGLLLFLLLLWILFRLNQLRRRVLACEERELVHDAAITAVKEERDVEREGWYGAGWRHGRERERHKRCAAGGIPQVVPLPVPLPMPYPDAVCDSGYKHHRHYGRRHHHYPHHHHPHQYTPAIGYPGY